MNNGNGVIGKLIVYKILEKTLGFPKKISNLVCDPYKLKSYEQFGITKQDSEEDNETEQSKNEFGIEV